MMTTVWYDAAVHCAGVAASEADAADKNGRFLTKTLAAFRSTGLLGVLVPTEYGGMGLGLAEYSHIAYILGEQSVSASVIWAMHSQQVHAIVLGGDPQLKAQVLPNVAAGNVYIGSVTTETESGGSLFSSSSSLNRTTRHGLVIDRFAPTVTGGRFADAFLIKTRAPDSENNRSTVLTFADRDQVEVRIGDVWASMGMRAVENVELHLRGTVPEHQLLSPLFDVMARDFFAPMAHIGWSSAWLGCASEAAMRVIRHLNAKSAKTGIPSDATLMALGGVRLRLETVSSYLDQTLVRYAEDISRGVTSETAPQIHLNALKTLASQNCFRAISELIDLVGLNSGYLQSCPLDLELRFRDLRSASLMYNDSRLLRSVGALSLLDRTNRLIGNSSR